jgi:hypothetical protein
MLNPTGDVKIETLLIITTILTAVAEGGYLTSLFCYIHEEYGQTEFGMISGFVLSAGALGLLAFDQGAIYVLLVAFGQTGGKEILEKNIIDSYGHFESYGYWIHVLFLITLIASGIGLITACLGYWYTKEQVKDENLEKKSLEKVGF